MSDITASGSARRHAPIPGLLRTPPRELSLGRIFGGGRPSDLVRLPRYLILASLGVVAIWGPITTYLRKAPLSFSSEMSLILPGSGAAASLNLADIGQASSYANSAFSSNAISPTETYKRLLSADRIVDAAATTLGEEPRAIGRPKVELVDQTGLIRVQMKGPTPEDARDRTEALRQAFFTEVDALRVDELSVREAGALSAIEDYRGSVADTRQTIAALQAETGLVSSAQYDRLVAAADDLRSDLAGLASDVAQKTEAVAALSRSLGIAPEQAAVSIKLYADADYTALLDEIALHTAALAQAGARYGLRHPEVTAARAALDAARTMARARAMALTGLSADAVAALDLAQPGARAELLAELVREEAAREGLISERDTVARRLDAETARLNKLAPVAARLEDMQRDFSVAEAVFASAIARSQSSKADIYASYPLVQVLENPSLPDRPTSPNRKLALAAGGAATMMLLLGLFLAWIRRPLIGRILARPLGAP
ncbi:hypothetical protein [Alloyangia pacifica]|uniref:hypothetical protein n=1 Tax=Alloyangia pacifica TaxID=311180 RepID=UPI0031D6C20E